MFKVIDLGPEGKPEESFADDRVAPPPPGVIRWVDLVEHDAEALELLRERFEFHPLAIEDCSSFELWSKVEEYDDYLFIVLHTFTADPEDPAVVEIHEIHAFLSEHYIVTVHDNPVPATELVWQRAAHERSVLEHGPCWALYRYADTMVDQTFPLLERVAAELEEREEAVLGRLAEDDVAKLFHLKRTLVTMRRVIRPMRDVIGILLRHEDRRINARTRLYMRDLYDHVVRCAETIEELRDLAANAMDAYNTAISNRTNEVMKRLTIFSVIFLPLSFITGFWGQNFGMLPTGRDDLYYMMLGSMIVIPIALLIWFDRRNWL